MGPTLAEFIVGLLIVALAIWIAKLLSPIVQRKLGLKSKK